MEPNDLYAFLRDPRLLELIELNKTTDNLFNVLTLNENQNSEALAWCMNPNEGHGQGDAVIKDFLEAAYAVSDPCKYDNKKFFSKWTPGKIRTSSFGSAFVTREFSIKVNNGTANGRLDLFLVDPSNKILVTIENKVKATLTSEQLEKYIKAVKSEIASREVFSGYDMAFIVMDKDLDAYTEEHLATLGNRWTLLDYRWLEASASRARLQIDRGNNAAQLLVSYCQSVTQWESPASQKISELSADLALTHPCVIEEMRKTNSESISKWRPSSLEGQIGELTIFLSQHRQVCEGLINIKGIASMIPRLLKASPLLSRDTINEGSYWVVAMPPTAKRLMRDDRWPIYVDLYKVAKVSSTSSPKFNLKLTWVRSEFNPEVCQEDSLRAYFDDRYKGLSKFASSDTRRVLIEEHMPPAEAIEATANLIANLNAGILNYLNQKNLYKNKH